MFEFHGWLSLHSDDREDLDPATLEERLDSAESALAREIEKADDDFSVFEIRRAGNGLRYISVHGLSNHRYEPVISLFRWAAENLTESYGLLYVWDDEDCRGDDANHTNAFRVWRVAQGKFDEYADPFLSPCVPTIEKPCS